MKKEKKINKAWYILGSIALTVVAIFSIPKIIESFSSCIYKLSQVSKSDTDDDWGPEIVKKDKENG